MSIKKHIPNTITCLNLLSGCMSILFIASGMPVKAAIMILVAGLFDFLDGFAARMLNEHSPIGRDLDSLSDVVSFGVAPGLIMSYMMNNGLDMPQLRVYDVDLMPCLGFMLPVFAAIRLARFNIDHSQDYETMPSGGYLLRAWPFSLHRCRWHWLRCTILPTVP